MDIFLLILFIIIFLSLKFHKNKFNEDFLAHPQTLCINGIFVIFVFIRHLTDYCQFPQNTSSILNFINTNLEQLIVTTFFFYSGYGIYESIKHKNNYVQKHLPKRIKKLYFNFLIAIISFIIINFIFNIKYSPKTILLSFFAWESIGNSNWYIFAIISMYSICYFCFRILKKNVPSLLSITLLTNIYIIILTFFKDSCWYNTVLCFVLGLWVSYFKDKIFKYLTKSNYTYIYFLIITTLLFYIFCKLHSLNVLFYELWTLSFVLLILLLSLKLTVSSKILLFLGKNTFWIYILQRIPMIILKQLNINTYNYYLFAIFSFAFTIIIAVIYKKIFDKIHLLKKTNRFNHL